MVELARQPVVEFDGVITTITGGEEAPSPPQFPARGEEKPDGTWLAPPPLAGGGREAGVMQRERIRQLRQNATDAEKIVWQRLRAKQIGGVRFRRQYPLGPYFVNFVCLTRRLIVEIDGGQHGAADAPRDEWLRAEGFTILRFWNHEVLTNIDGVLITITEYAEAPPPPDLLPRGEEG